MRLIFTVASFAASIVLAGVISGCDTSKDASTSSGGGDGGDGGSGDGGSGDGGSGDGGSGDGGNGDGGSEPTDCPRIPSDDERLPDALAQDYLNMHNEKRHQYCLPELTWDADLATVAQAYAKKRGSGEATGHNPERDQEYAALTGCTKNCPMIGENIAWHSPWDFFPFSSLVEGWLEEEDPNQCNTGGSHYTQIVWSTTTRVGCGAWIHPDSDEIMLVCNYLDFQLSGPAFPEENCSCTPLSPFTPGMCK